MSMKLRSLPLALMLVGTISLPAGAAVPQDNSSELLMRGAKKWVAKDRPDLAKNMLKKLILIDPSSEEALFMLGNIELRSGKPDEALKYLNALQRLSPDGARTRELADAYRLATSDKNTLDKARALGQSGKYGEAEAILKQVYHTPPRGEAAFDYYRIVGASKSGYSQAQDDLAALYKETGDVRYRLLQLELQARFPDHLAAAVRGYEELAGNPDTDRKALHDGWRDAVYKLADGDDKLKAIERFLATYSQDKEMTQLQADVRQNLASEARLTKENVAMAASAVAASSAPQTAAAVPKVAKLVRRDKPQPKPKQPAVIEPEAAAENPDIEARTEALDALQDGKIEQAEAALTDLLKRRPNDPEVVGGLGFVKLKQGKPAEAATWFAQALEVAKAAKGETARWESLIQTANFWAKLRAAEALLKDSKLPEAEAAIREALAIKPSNPNGLAVLGNIKLAANDYPAAESAYREALQQEGYNVSAMVGLIDLLKRTQRQPEALALVEKTLQEYPAEWKEDPGSQARLLREESNLYLALHRPGPAVKALEQGVKIDPKNPWARFFLAKLYISLDLVPLGKRVMQEGVTLDPQNAEMHYVQALVLLSIDDYAGGLETLNQVPASEMTDDMRDARNRALIQYATRQAENKLAQGDRKEAIRIMSVAQSQAEGSYSATEQVAEGWFKLGLQEQGLNAMRRLPHPMPLETQLHYASLLNRAKKDQELVEYLPTLQIPDGNDETSKKQRESIRDIELAMAGRQFDKLREAGKNQQAQQLADSVLEASNLSKTEYFRAHRTYFFKAALPDDTLAALLDEKEQSPDDLDIRWDLAYAYYQTSQNTKAQQELHELLALTKPDDIDGRLRIARLQQNVGDGDGAWQTMDDLINRFPNNLDVLFQAGNFAQSRGEYNKAMDYYQQTRDLAQQQDASRQNTSEVAQQDQSGGILLNLLPATQLQSLSREEGAGSSPKLANTQESARIYRTALASDTSKEKVATASSPAVLAEQEMADIEARRTGKIETALDIQSKQATNGLSTYNVTEIPVRATFPIGYEAQGTVQVDKVDIDAGSLAVADAASFGTIKAYNYTPPQPLTQKESGASVGIGYEQGPIKADIGTVGIGLPVSNVVGGIRTGGSLGRLSYSLNLSRRPYTGSQISYAGARDPVTGSVWGGVTHTGVSLYMSTELNDFNVVAMGTYGLLRGKNVLNNDRLFLRAAVDTDIVSFSGAKLNVGANVNYMGFSKNESFYTYGNGGYYSPQSSLSFGIPFELSGSGESLSYRLRTQITYSRTREDNALYYPTDPLLEAMAGGASYTGGNGGGFGFGLLGMAEYRVAPQFVLGGRFSMDRSAYYAPNALQIYLRYLFKPEPGPLKLPQPVVPYSQY